MSLFLKQQDTRTPMQKRIAEELQERAIEKAKLEQELPDGVTDSAYLKDTKQTTSLAWVWALIVVAIIVVTIWLIIVAIG